jgi:hypothetical protein
MSLLMVSTSVVASACDLSCLLHQAQPDCHARGSATAKEAGMSMSTGVAMDMGPSESQRMTPPRDGTGTAAQESMSMPADMDMGSERRDSPVAVNARTNAKPSHLMPMPPRPEMATVRLLRAAKPGMETSVMPDHSWTLSTCTDETCSRISASASLPSADHHCQPNALRRLAIRASSPVNPWTEFPWIRPGTSPPESAAAKRLATILRI